MADFFIRPALRTEAPQIRSLIHLVRINPTGLSWKRFLVAVTAQGDIIGCGQIKHHGDKSRELASIAVLVQARGQGVARAIIEALLVHEHERPIYLMCRARLMVLYNKFGFHAIGLDEMPLYFQRICRAERIFNFNAAPEDRLNVMRLK